ncbi:MAG: type II toxin-antitoxin system Phd/YefM family antitoxin, partial [bacterium]
MYDVATFSKSNHRGEAAMTSVGVRQLKAGLSRYLQRVRAGERITVTARGRPVAVL